jgi:hypothetical protein
MKKLLVVFLLAIVAGTTIAATVTHLVSKNTENEGRWGQRSVTFDVDGVDYIITDKATLDEIDRVTRPEIELGQKQAEVGAEQARIGVQQRHAKTEEQRRQFQAAQRALADQQIELAKQQREAGEAAHEELEKIFRNAVRAGIARKR